MDVVEIIKELRQELERIDSLILALDSLQSGKRRGRPPKLLQQLRESKGESGGFEIAPVRKTRKKRKSAPSKGRKKATKRKAAENPT